MNPETIFTEEFLSNVAFKASTLISRLLNSTDPLEMSIYGKHPTTAGHTNVHATNERARMRMRARVCLFMQVCACSRPIVAAFVLTSNCSSDSSFLRIPFRARLSANLKRRLMPGWEHHTTQFATNVTTNTQLMMFMSAWIAAHIARAHPVLRKSSRLRTSCSSPEEVRRGHHKALPLIPERR